MLVELKQAAQLVRRRRRSSRKPFALGDIEIVTVSDGFFYLDGGAMFGVVPKTFWEKKAPPDDRNRIRMTMRCLLVRGARTMLIDAGCGRQDDAEAGGNLSLRARVQPEPFARGGGHVA